MVLEPRVPAYPLVMRQGDVIGVEFAREDYTVIFVPGSTDVILCSRQEWQGLAGFSESDTLGSSTGSATERQGDVAAPPLQKVLAGLGASFV